MVTWLRQLDELLRGDRVRAETLAADTSDVRSRVLTMLVIGLGCTYGFFMGWYAVSVGGIDGLKQMGAATVKLPLLFLLTLGVTFPSLYVFNALVGCRLKFASTLRLLLSAMAVNLAVGASLGPILGFFTLSTKSYAFMVLLNVVLLGVAGGVGLGFLLRTLNALAVQQAQAELEKLPAAPPVEQVARRDLEPEADYFRRIEYIRQRREAERQRHAMRAQRGGLRIFLLWVVIYALVGTQMGWVLRPFVGAPGTAFSLLRERQGSFFTGFFGAIRGLTEGK